MDLPRFLRTPFSQNTSGRLLLSPSSKSMFIVCYKHTNLIGAISLQFSIKKSGKWQSLHFVYIVQFQYFLPLTQYLFLVLDMFCPLGRYDTKKPGFNLGNVVKQFSLVHLKTFAGAYLKPCQMKLLAKIVHSFFLILFFQAFNYFFITLNLYNLSSWKELTRRSQKFYSTINSK